MGSHAAAMGARRRNARCAIGAGASGLLGAMDLRHWLQALEPAWSADEADAAAQAGDPHARVMLDLWPIGSRARSRWSSTFSIRTSSSFGGGVSNIDALYPACAAS